MSRGKSLRSSARARQHPGDGPVGPGADAGRRRHATLVERPRQRRPTQNALGAQALEIHLQPMRRPLRCLPPRQGGHIRIQTRNRPIPTVPARVYRRALAVASAARVRPLIS